MAKTTKKAAKTTKTAKEPRTVTLYGVGGTYGTVYFYSGYLPAAPACKECDAPARQANFTDSLGSVCSTASKALGLGSGKQYRLTVTVEELPKTAKKVIVNEDDF